MGEALITRRGVAGGVKVADGYPKKIGGYTITIPDLVGCKGFALFLLGDGSLSGYSRGQVASVFYDGDKVSYCMVTTGDITTAIYTDIFEDGSFDPKTGTITLTKNYSLSSNCATQCIYW